MNRHVFYTNLLRFSENIYQENQILRTKIGAQIEEIRELKKVINDLHNDLYNNLHNDFCNETFNDADDKSNDTQQCADSNNDADDKSELSPLFESERRCASCVVL